MRTLLAALVVFSAVPLAQAQSLEDFPTVKALASKASDNVEISLSGPMLHFASAFLDDSDPDSAPVKELLSHLKQLTVHSYTFDSEQPTLSKESVQTLRSALTAPPWVRLVSERERARSGSVDIYARQEKDQTTGMVLIATEPKEFTLIQIEGNLSAEQLRSLARHFGSHTSKASRSEKADAVWL